MSKCFLLMKVQFLGIFGINRLIHAGTFKEKLQAALVGIAVIIVAAMFVFYSILISILCASYGFLDILPSLMLMVSSITTLIFTFVKSSGTLFGFKDYDTIMSLPVRSSTVIASRLLSVYVMNFLFTCIVMVPAMVVYCLNKDISSSVYIMIVVTLFLAPLIPMIAGMVIGVVITAVSARFRYKNLFAILLSFIGVLGIMFFSFSMQYMEETVLVSLVSYVMVTINNIYPPAAILSEAIVGGDVSSFALFSLISILATALFIMILSFFYNKINSALFSRQTRSNYKMGTLKASSPSVALYKKELRRLVTSPIYLLNTCIGAVLMIVGSIALLFLGLKDIEKILDEPELFSMIKLLLPFIMSLFISMSSTTSASMSLEGKSRGVLFSIPVGVKTVFNSKIAVNLTILLPSVLICGTILTFCVNANLLEAFFIFAMPAVYSLFISVIGIAINLKFPKYDWKSEQQAIKQSLSVIATLGIGFLCTLAPLVLVFLLPEYIIHFLTATTLVIAAITLIVYIRLGRVKLYM